MNAGVIVSYAHDFVQGYPLSRNELVCTRCEHVRPTIGNDGVRCTKHFESSASGFLNESDGFEAR